MVGGGERQRQADEAAAREVKAARQHVQVEQGARGGVGSGPGGEPFPIVSTVVSAVVFKAGINTAAAEEFVRFLVAEG